MRIKMRFALLISIYLISPLGVWAKEDSVPAYDQAIAGQRIASLAEAGLSDIDTLWIPERYRDDNKAALYLKGKRYVTPKGHNDVTGFLQMTNSDYLVAVRQEGVPLEQADLPERAGSSVVFYAVSETGETKAQLGVIKPVGPVVVGKQGIFVSRNETNGLRSYAGYDANGNPVSGPQGVYFATPSSDGGWLIEMLDEEHYDYIDTAYYRVDADGRKTRIRDGIVRGTSHREMMNTSAAFVNSVPYADSVRTGFHMYLWQSMQVTDRGSRNWMGSFISFELDRIEAKIGGLLGFGRSYTKTGYYDVDYGTNRSVRAVVARDLVKRSALVGDKDRPLAVTQLDSSDHKGGYVGFADLYAQEGEPQHSTPVFKIAGAGFELFRSVVGNNTGKASAASKNDAYVFVTPKGAVMVLAYTPERIGEDTVKAYEIMSDKAVDGQAMEAFLTQYQMFR
ncbi:hypothetical protein TspCOW1_13110 [Thiohalobacter sp. COW1]|nr:hypothetical protein TspCOW1_13110 [Thiohalobacter sp. COW1]